MGAAGWIEIALYIALLIAITPVLGAYMTRVYRGEIGIGVVDRLTVRLFGDAEQDWKAYARSVLVSSAVFFVVLYVILRPRMPYDVTLNTTASFITNTNWQYYAGETTLTNLQQMAGLAVQNFVSAAVGISVAIAFIRALAARSSKTIGNYYRDLIRTLVYVLLPISVVVGLVLVSQGVIQSLKHAPGEVVELRPADEAALAAA
jgi:potassium-transporting ATPase potassium-binding subunit